MVCFVGVKMSCSSNSNKTQQKECHYSSQSPLKIMFMDDNFGIRFLNSVNTKKKKKKSILWVFFNSLIWKCVNSLYPPSNGMAAII